MIHTVQDLSVVNENKSKFFFNSLTFSMIQLMMEIWSLVPLSFLNPAWMSGSFSVHILLKPSLENFERYFPSVWNEGNCRVVWTFFGIALLWHWNENWPFPVLWPLLSFPNLLSCWVQCFHSINFSLLVNSVFTLNKTCCLPSNHQSLQLPPPS